MRTAFVEALCELAERDARVLLLTADLGWSVLERFAERFPDRFINVGVAEQNMIGIATGLARQGFVPFAYSIATFASMRGYEQFRNGPVLHGLPVRVVGVGGGFSYGHAGPTHHALEDLTITRTLPGLTVVAPGDGPQTRAVIDATQNLAGPAYLRVDKTDYPDLPNLHGQFALDEPNLLRRGQDLLLLATGSIAHEALKAADVLSAQGISAAVALLAHLSLEPAAPLVALLRRFRQIVTIEEGSIAGGLGSLAAEAVADYGLSARLLRLGVRTCGQEHLGGRDYLLRQHGLDAASVAAQAGRFAARRVAA